MAFPGNTPAINIDIDSHINTEINININIDIDTERARLKNYPRSSNLVELFFLKKAKAVLQATHWHQKTHCWVSRIVKLSATVKTHPCELV